jgi:hypothetical protein
MKNVFKILGLSGCLFIAACGHENSALQAEPAVFQSAVDVYYDENYRGEAKGLNICMGYYLNKEAARNAVETAYVNLKESNFVTNINDIESACKKPFGALVNGLKNNSQFKDLTVQNLENQEVWKRYFNTDRHGIVNYFTQQSKASFLKGLHRYDGTSK